MHGRIIQRIFSILDSHKSSRLLISFFAQSWYFFQILSFRESAIFCSVSQCSLPSFLQFRTHSLGVIYSLYSSWYLRSLRNGWRCYPILLSVCFFWSTSCWYCPTPMDLASIFTSSAKGSANLRPMEIKQFTHSHVITRELVSGTTGWIHRSTCFETTKTWIGLSKAIFLMKNSVSRLAVPFPIEMASML